MAGKEGCKVDIVVEQFGLDTVEVQYASTDDHLYARWTGEDGRSMDGYRTLTEWFNKQVLKRVYDQHALQSSSKRLAADYDILTGDDDISREDLKDELRAEGVEVDRLVDSFVSWGTMRNHLNECLDGEKPTSEAQTDWESESIDIATDVAKTKVRQALQSLMSKGDIARGDEADIDIQVQLSCPDCPTQVPFHEAVEQGYVCKDHRE